MGRLETGNQEKTFFCVWKKTKSYEQETIYSLTCALATLCLRKTTQHIVYHNCLFYAMQYRMAMNVHVEPFKQEYYLRDI